MVDRRALAQVGVPHQAEPLEQLEVAVDGRGVGRRAVGAGLLAQPRADRLRGGVLQRVDRREHLLPLRRQPQAAGPQPLGQRGAAPAVLAACPCPTRASLCPACGRLEAVTEQRAVAIWRDGAAVAVPADEPVLTAFDQGLGRGDGVFESVAVVGGATPHLAAHLRAPGPSAALLELADPGERVWRALVDAVLETGRPTSRASSG